MFAVSATAAPVFHYEARFTPLEQARLERWIGAVLQGLEDLGMTFPFDVHVHFHRATRGRGPVPWAHTTRGTRQGVQLHVDPRLSDADFLADWTAPHELSHLLIPYLGSDAAWFAEGFASYLQYFVMGAMRELEHGEAIERYRARMQRANRRFRPGWMSLAEAAPRLRAARDYPTMYWGGAVYFLRVDAALRERHGTTLQAVLAAYTECCRHRGGGLDDLIGHLDRLSGSRVFSEEMAHFQQQPGFPAYRESLAIIERRGLWHLQTASGP